jgi:low temperature requirement protein LtrA
LGRPGEVRLYVHHRLVGQGSSGFALSYASFQFTLTILWWRTGVHDPDHRPLSRPYSFIFLLNTLMFAASAFVPPAWRFSIWGFVLLLSLLLPIYMFFCLGKRNAQARQQIKITSAVRPSLVERFGLFTIIVLGEVIVSIVGGVVRHHHLTWNLGGTALLGTVIAIGIWWLYFDFISHRIPQGGLIKISSWYYLHLPVTIGIASVGASVLNVLAHTGDPLPSEVRWLLVASLSVVLIGIALLTRTVQSPRENQRSFYFGSTIMLISGILISGLGFLKLSVIHILTLLILLLLAPIFFGFLAWVKEL